MTGRLAERMKEAADTLEEVSALYGYGFPAHCKWDANELRAEAPHVEDDQ